VLPAAREARRDGRDRGRGHPAGGRLLTLRRCPPHLMWVALALPASAQTAVRGGLVDTAGHPIAGGTVEVSRAEQRPPGATSDPRGEWTVLVPDGGEWEIRATADGFAPSVGRIWAGDERVLITLEPDLETAARRLLTEGSRLQEAGLGAAARSRYESALTLVRGPTRVVIQRAAARASLQADEPGPAYSHLWAALVQEPGDPETRRLLLGVAARLQREPEAQAWLQLLDREGPRRARAAALPPVPTRPLDGTVRGRFSARLETRSPLGAPDAIVERLGGRKFARVEPVPEPGSVESVELYVPERCGAQGCGLFVWVSPSASGRLPGAEREPGPAGRRSELIPVLDERGVIWVAANRSGNPEHITRRTRLALDAAHAVKQAYPVDPERVFVGGHSGGGRIASRLAVLYPEVFRGGLFNMGVDYWDELKVPHRPGNHWPPAFGKPGRDALRRCRDRSRFVFATAEYDFNRTQTYAIFAAFAAEGLERATLIDLPGVGHSVGLAADVLERALDWMESGRRGAPP